MLDNSVKEILKNLDDEAIVRWIDLAYKEKQNRDEAKEAKYMSAIRIAIEDYLENVGTLTFYFDENEYNGEIISHSVSIDKSNPLVCEQGNIYI